MKVRGNTDVHIEDRQAQSARVSAAVEHALGRFRDQVTRMEVHLSDQITGKCGPQDKRCVMQARLEVRQPSDRSPVKPAAE